MKDVAELVGVSIQTVSAVINNKPGITEETRDRVLEAVRQLGYRPYSVARSLRTGQTRTLALIVSDLSNPSFGTMASAAEDYAHRFGYSLTVHNTHDDVEREANYIESLTQRWIDGVMYVSAEDELSSQTALEQAGIPSVAIDRIPEGYDGPSVTLNRRTTPYRPGTPPHRAYQRPCSPAPGARAHRRIRKRAGRSGDCPRCA
jgi:LacI family transcriptional regulator